MDDFHYHADVTEVIRNSPEMTTDERRQLVEEWFEIHRDGIELRMQWMELRYEIIKAVDASPIGKFVFWLAGKLERYKWLQKP